MLISIVLGVATSAVVFAIEKGIDAAVCNKKARYAADDFDDDDDHLFCEDCGVSPQAPQQTIDPLFEKWRGAVHEQLNILRGEEQQAPVAPATTIPVETNPPIEVIRTEGRDIIDDVFEDIVEEVTPEDIVDDVEEVVEEAPQQPESTSAEETATAAAPEREPNGRFKKGKKKK